MKLFIGNKYNLKLYIIPEIIEDSYLIKYHSSIDDTDKNILITNKNDKLIINNNLNMNLYYDNKSADSIELKVYNNYRILINDTSEELYFYCLPNEMEYQDYEINKKRIRIGQSPSNEISVKDDSFKTSTVEIINAEDNWYIKSEIVPIYINKSFTTYSKINYGDEIFISGLKIIWLKGFIRINYHPNSLIYIPEYDIKDFKDIYSNNEEKTINETNYPNAEEKDDIVETITLENPPLQEKNNDLYYFIALGSSFTLAITSVATLLTIFLAIASGSSTLREEKNLLIISILLILCSILFPFFIKLFQKRSNEKKEGKRIILYSEYLKQQKDLVKSLIEKKTIKLKESYPSSEEWPKRITTDRIWYRNIKNSNFLTIRFGTGNINANIIIDSHKLSFTYENSILKEQLTEIQKLPLTMENVPVPISLIDNNYLPILITSEKYNSYINMLLLQLISFYSNSNLKLVFLVSEENHNLWNNYKYIPHINDEEKAIRFFAYDKTDTNNIIQYLEETYQTRIQKLKNSSINNDKDYTLFEDYYLIITDKMTELSSYEIFSKIINGKNYGFSLISFEKFIAKKYVEYNTYLEVNNNSIISNNINSKYNIPETFKPDFGDNIDIYNIIKSIANLPIISYNNKAALPKEVSLLDMYKVGKVEQLNILDRWKNNNSIISLSTPVGIAVNNELIELDLHEKYQGPNGLIAGMVGSGKLELLKTYISSMCINYSPNEVQFILIDYKKGGLVSSFKNNETTIPHIVGTLTELDNSELFRFYTILKNESQRRLDIFTNIQNKTGDTGLNIYKYRKLYNEGTVVEPMSHIFLIFYEYYEIYNQYPEIFKELLDLIYNSNPLGIHLILCTQKPGEVLNNQILTNSRLKIGLKLQSLNDSEKLLKRREAASIDNPGRFYLEVGYNEAFKQVQSAFSSASYNPEDIYKEKLDDSLSFITNSGIIYKEINEDKVVINNNNGSELENVCNYINNLAKDKDIIPDVLYLPSLSDNIPLSKLIRKYKYETNIYQYNSIVGEYDKPNKKEQGLFTINLATSNNIIICGLPGSGKTNHIATILFSTCLFHSPKEINIYILDSIKGKLKSFGKMPQVGEYISDYNSEKIENLYEMLNKEIDKRKTTTKEYAYSFVDYNNNSPYKIPLIFVVINDYKEFIDNDSELAQKYNTILEEGAKLGIIFITSITQYNQLNQETMSKFKTILGTQFADPFDYRYILDAPKGLIPKNCYGRGITKIDNEVFEYQTAFIASNEEVDNVILENAIELKNNYKTKAKPILVNLMAGGKKNEK